MLRKQKWPVQHRAEYDNTFSFLWYAVILGIYQSIMQIIAYCKKTLYDFSKISSLEHSPKTFHIFEQKAFRPNRIHYLYIAFKQQVPGIGRVFIPHIGKSLTRRPSNDDRYLSISNIFLHLFYGKLSNVFQQIWLIRIIMLKGLFWLCIKNPNNILTYFYPVFNSSLAAKCYPFLTSPENPESPPHTPSYGCHRSYKSHASSLASAPSGRFLPVL